MLLDVCIALGAFSELDPLLAFIIDTAAEVTDCKAASILLYDEASDRLRFVAATGADPDELARIPVPINGSIAGAIFTENRPLVVDDTARDNRHYDLVGEAVSLKTEKLVGVPLRVDGRVIGVLEALNPRSGSFADHVVESLTLVAAQAAVAVRNAQQQAALRSAYDALSRLDRLKSDFMAIASHELRTPLTTVIGFATLIEQEAEGAMGEFARAVHTAAVQAQHVVESMEQLSQLPDTREGHHLERIVLQNVVLRTVESLKPSAARKGVLLRPRLHAEPSWVGADALHLGHALHAVLDNAIAFAPAGSTVDLVMTVHASCVALAVHDRGPGLALEECERIFEPFYQVGDPDTREHEGVGLGLTLARRVLALYDGSVQATSEGIGQGCTLTLTLPTLSAAV